MPNKELPIQFFETRTQDDTRVEGGGSDEEPKWLLPEPLLIKRAEQLLSELDSFSSKIAENEKQQSIIPFTFKAYMSEKSTAKTKRRYVSSIFDTSREYSNIISVLDRDELLVRVSTVYELNTITEKIKDFDACKYGLSCLEKISSFNPLIRASDKSESYKIRLLDFQNYEENSAILRMFEKVLYNSNLDYKRTQYTKSLPIFKVHGESTAIIDTLKANNVFEALFSFEPMPKHSITLDSIPFSDNIPVLLPEENYDYATLGILDNGIEKIPHLSPWVTNRKTVYPSDNISASHGTVVAGIALYGDSLEKSSWVGHKGLKLFDAAVYPDTSKEPIEEDELVENIREVITANHEAIKIWNLSISIKKEISENNFSDFGAFLDDMQERYNILICKSAGNCDNFKSGHPRGKLHQGADSILSLVVGSIAHEKSQHDQSEKDNPSPFTRIGPGPEFIIKPEVVHYGGNAGIRPDGKMSLTGVRSFSKDGSIASYVGTSFATPRISALATGLQQEIKQEFDSLLIKSLIIHNAEYSDNLTIPYEERTKYVGFGKPHNIHDILHNDPHEITLVLRSSLEQGKMIDVLDFPMPSCLVKDGYFTGQIIATLVYSPILNPTQGSEYCQSNIDIMLGTYDDKKDRRSPTHTVLNPVGRTNSKNIFLYGLYSKRKTGMGQFSQRERLLIQFADKYYPVKKYAVDLSELTDANKKKYMTANKNWFLKLRGLYRSFTEQNAAAYAKRLSQEFCLLITIRDPLLSVNIYDESIKKLDAFGFIHNQVQLVSHVRIES